MKGLENSSSQLETIMEEAGCLLLGWDNMMIAILLLKNILGAPRHSGKRPRLGHPSIHPTCVAASC